MLRKTLITAIASAMLLTAPIGLLPSVGTAWAEVVDSEVLYRRKAWEVSIVQFDDGSYACLAQVGESGKSFAVWADASNNASLQFYDQSWSFDNSTADVVLKIDRRADWALNDADLNQNSVFFTLPDEDSSYRFLREVMRGNVLNLLSSSGNLIQRYSLAGSSASIVKLTECVDLLKGLDNDGNPFN